MRRFRKYRKPNYSRTTKLILIAVLVLLTAVLGYIIMLEARQIKLERAGQLPAQQTAQPVQTQQEGETDADAAAGGRTGTGGAAACRGGARRAHRRGEEVQLLSEAGARVRREHARHG